MNKKTGLALFALMSLSGINVAQALTNTSESNSFSLKVVKYEDSDSVIQGSAVNNPVQPVLNNLENYEELSLGTLSFAETLQGQCDLNLATDGNFALVNNEGQTLANYHLVLVTTEGEIPFTANDSLSGLGVDCASVLELRFKGVEFFPDAPAGLYNDVISLQIATQH
uniref:Spore coat protein U domain-containing protein n=1 Tax=uncultured Thiotrichaceae bacterium TaxID=298394 RepID=A0A6S6SQR6_9GAMM|nr:MAG: Unknown protein [uncultured Thiotrichaceae bacterium]